MQNLDQFQKYLPVLQRIQICNNNKLDNIDFYINVMAIHRSLMHFNADL